LAWFLFVYGYKLLKLKVSEAEFQNKKDEAKLHAQQFHRLNKHLQQMRKPTQKNIRAVKPSIEGR